MLKSSESDCFLGLDIFEDNQCDALFCGMQLRFPNSQRVPLVYSRKAPPGPSTEQVNVTARLTTFSPAGHEALILGELLTQSFPENSEDLLEESPAFCSSESPKTLVNGLQFSL